MAELSERFEDKYGVNAKAVAEEVLLDFPVKSIGIDQALKFYFEKKGSEIEVNDTFLKEFVEALADSKYSLPRYAKIILDPFPEFEIPMVVATIPKSKGVLQNFKEIVSNDDLRPAMTGVYISENGQVIVGTDAHKLIAFRDDSYSTYKGKIIDLKRFISSGGKRVEFIDEKYPNYEGVIPKDNSVINDIDLVSLNNYLAGCKSVAKNIRISSFFHVNFFFKDVELTFDLDKLQDVIYFILANGYTKANFEYSTSTRALVIKTNGEAILGLVMPIYQSGQAPVCTKRVSIESIQKNYSSDKQPVGKARKVEVERKKETPKGKYDLSQLSEDEQAQAKELMEAIETFQFLLDSMFEDNKMAIGGIVEAFSSPQLVDGMYGAISTFAKGGMTEAKQTSIEFAQGGEMPITREQRINAYKQMLAQGGQTYAEAQEKWNKDAGLPTKKDVMEFVKEHPEVLLKRGGRPKKK